MEAIRLGATRRSLKCHIRIFWQPGVKFYAALGNHDDPKQRFYKPFNMNGQRYYTFKPNDRVRFFALDSNYMDPEQLAWLDRETEGF